MKISRRQFETWVREALDELPPFFRRRLENLAVFVEEEPPPDVREDLELETGDDLYGLYQGVPHTRRGVDYGNVLPDRITLYRRPLVMNFPDRHALRRAVRDTVLHEVGHHFGLDEETLARLERDEEEEEP